MPVIPTQTAGGDPVPQEGAQRATDPDSVRPNREGDTRRAAVPIFKLRSELRASLRKLRGTPYLVVEDPVMGRFFRVGYDEWRFACQLNGIRSIEQAYRRFRQLAANDKTSDLVPQRIEPLCRWLVQHGLIHQVPSNVAVSRPPAISRPPAMSRPPAVPPPLRLNPFYIKVPLVRPDRMLSRLTPMLQWALTRWCFVLWLGLCLTGLHSVYTELPKFLETAKMFFAPNTWVYLWLAWLVLKLVHETAHGVVCKYHGGFVADGGVAFILFSPVAYVDVTSAWRFRDRWQRIATSAAGMYVEFAIAAAAAIVWRSTESETVDYVCHAIIMAATVTTLLFNANPLMRFDGYYMLSDALDLPNLYMEGRSYVASLGSRWFLGEATAPRLPNDWRGIVVRGYGLAAAFWRVVVCVSMVIGAGALFHGAGLAIAAFGVVAWMVIPFWNLGKAIMGNSPEQCARRRRFVRSAIVAAVGLVTLGLVPWPGGMRVPAVVTYEPLENLRAEAAGFVESVHVTPRQEVSVGTLLVTLRNDDLVVASNQLDCELAQAKIRAQTLKRRGRIGQYQGELEQISALEEQQHNLAQQLDGLRIQSPMDGRVVDDDLESLVGMYVDTGTPIVRVASESRKEIHVAIPETFVESFVKQTGETPRVAIRGAYRSRRLGELVKVEPRATLAVRHPALGANNGGPLPVESAELGEDHHEGVRLMSPHFHGVVRLTAEDSKRLRDGQLAAVTLYDRRETVARRVYRGTREWIQDKISMSGY